LTPAEFEAISPIPAPILDETNKHYLKLDAMLARDKLASLTTRTSRRSSSASD
jgi:hypothetical protein